MAPIRIRRSQWILSFCLLALLAISSPVGADDVPIDWQKARQLRQKQQAGQTLTEEEQAYLQRAMQARRAGQRPRRPAQPRGERMEPKPHTGLTPLTEFKEGEKYKGETGGLYGEGRNEPPAEHREAALKAAQSIQPLNEQGQPDANGKIVLVSVGMSNTTGEFQVFVQRARQDDSLNPHLVIVDTAQGGQDAHDWADPESRFREEKEDVWTVQARRLQQAGVTPEQVQVAWIKQARRNPAGIGEFPKHAKALEQDQAEIVRQLNQRFPNLKLVLLSSRIYAGYAGTPLNPEPYAYESAWANQWLIAKQIKGDPSLNYDPEKGEVKVPVLLWGPYLWADGEKGRASDDLVYVREDLAGDGTHPSQSGKEKVTRELLEFFKTSPFAKSWFVGE